jgi:demethylmenaquinone methyltransferase/2-methoxy-6-polyprenyl-1,4-benzoquinol methylase
MADRLPHDNVTPFDDPDRSKKEQVAEMFDRVANRYDVMNRLLSAGIDITSVIELQTGDSETINFADNSFDAVTVAFGVRNFENLESGLKEMLRVLKPGGKLIVLEFSRPRTRIFRSLYNLYMSIVAPEVARWIARNKKAYQYLNQSANLFPERQNFVEILNRTGYSNTSFKPLSAGICCIYIGEKLVG